MFLFEDLPTRADWYMCAGWRELAEYVDRAKRDYGADPGWAEYLPQADRSLSTISSLIGKSKTELRETERWPAPPQMRKMKSRVKPTTATFFEYLDDWWTERQSIQKMERPLFDGNHARLDHLHPGAAA
jgi:hypothetical protein